MRWPGSVHDARVYMNSDVNKKFVNKTIADFQRQLVPGYSKVPPFLIGDPAYPLLPNVMKEYANCYEIKHIYFNNVLRSSRNQIECAFGRLKARWRILNRAVDVELNFSSKMIYSCFVLHNFCELHGVEVPNDVLQAQIQNEREHSQAIDRLYSYNTSQGKMVRDTLVEYIHEKYFSRPIWL